MLIWLSRWDIPVLLIDHDFWFLCSQDGQISYFAHSIPQALSHGNDFYHLLHIISKSCFLIIDNKCQGFQKDFEQELENEMLTDDTVRSELKFSTSKKTFSFILGQNIGKLGGFLQVWFFCFMPHQDTGRLLQWISLFICKTLRKSSCRNLPIFWKVADPRVECVTPYTLKCLVSANLNLCRIKQRKKLKNAFALSVIGYYIGLRTKN